MGNFVRSLSFLGLILSISTRADSKGHTATPHDPASSNGVRSETVKKDSHAAICQQLDKAFVPADAEDKGEGAWYKSIRPAIMAYKGSLKDLESCEYSKSYLSSLIAPKDLIRAAIEEDDTDLVDRILKDYPASALENYGLPVKDGLLAYAIKAGTPGMVRELIKKGADKNFSSNDAQPPIKDAIERALRAKPSDIPWNLATSLDILNLFADKETLNTPYTSPLSREGEMPLYDAVTEVDAPNQLAVVQFLIRKGAPVNKVATAGSVNISAAMALKSDGDEDLRSLEKARGDYSGKPVLVVEDALKKLSPEERTKAFRTAKLVKLLVDSSGGSADRWSIPEFYGWTKTDPGDHDWFKEQHDVYAESLKQK